MASTWSGEGNVTLPGAVSYTLSAGNEPTDQWRVSVAMPPPNLQAIAGPGPWPALYLLDAPITFVIAAQTAQTTMAFSLGQLQPIAVVGIGPATDDLRRIDAHRIRNLTPTTFVPPHLEARANHGTGGADGMLDLIVNEIAPYLESQHPLDPAGRGLGGISLGGLVTCWALLTRPTSFRRFLAVSPSLYWDGHLLLDEHRLPGVPAPDTEVYLAVGEHEEDPAYGWPVVPPEMLEVMSDIKMVSETISLADRLRRAGTHVRTDIIPDENHATIWPAAATRGLVHLYATGNQPGHR
ncbi:MAG: alpha/beta hydrolase-fold protein [Actinomycetota bacterium]|nr:alpha/beta hydrolase-fold protein [Actinomycetota bacterium]